MSALALAGAPPATRPLRFLLTSPLWGVLAGVMLLLDPLVLDGRWAPPAASRGPGTLAACRRTCLDLHQATA